jgi:hypothetical protein
MLDWVTVIYMTSFETFRVAPPTNLYFRENIQATVVFKEISSQNLSCNISQLRIVVLFVFSMRYLSTYFSDILDLLRSSTTRKGEEEAAVVENVVENVEVDKEEEDSEDEVLVLENTTGGQDSKSAEVIIYVTVIH